MHQQRVSRTRARNAVAALVLSFGLGCIEFATDEQICAEVPAPLGCPVPNDAGEGGDAGSGDTLDSGMMLRDAGDDAGEDAGTVADAGVPQPGIHSAHFGIPGGATDVRGRIGESGLELLVTGLEFTGATRVQLTSALDGGVILNRSVSTVGTTDAGTQSIRLTSVTLPWTAPIGPVSVTVDRGDSAWGSAEPLLHVDPVTVSPDQGSDTARGTVTEPLASFARALELTGANGTIQLLAGHHAYGGMNMIDLPAMQPGITVYGEGKDQTLLFGDGGAWTEDGGANSPAVYVAGLHLNDGTTIRGISIEGYRLGISASGYSGSSRLEDVKIRSLSPIGAAGPSELTLVRVEADATSAHALEIGGSSRVTAFDSTFRSVSSSATVVLYDAVHLSLVRSRVNPGAMAEAGISGVTFRGTLTLHDSMVTSSRHGIIFTSGTPRGHLESVDSGVLTTASYSAVELDGTATFESSTFSSGDAPGFNLRSGAHATFRPGQYANAIDTGSGVPCINAQSGSDLVVHPDTLCRGATSTDPCSSSSFVSGSPTTCQVQ